MGAALALVVGTVAVLSGGDDGGTATEVFLEPIASVTPDPFTDSVVSVSTTTAAVQPTAEPAATVAPEGKVKVVEVTGSEPGLYGGTRERAECDPERLVAFLEANPDKAKAWADVQGIEPSGIASYVDGLTPVVLRRDTLVTNHGYRNGVATPKESVLQAGTAVLVDAFGVPRAKCECGNPLAEPRSTSSKPTYRGAAWTGFTPNAVVEVDADVRVEELVLVDAETQGRFTRPVGSTGSGDGDLSTETCDIYPKDPSCPQQGKGGEERGEEGTSPTSGANANDGHYEAHLDSGPCTNPDTNSDSSTEEAELEFIVDGAEVTGVITDANGVDEYEGGVTSDGNMRISASEPTFELEVTGTFADGDVEGTWKLTLTNGSVCNLPFEGTRTTSTTAGAPAVPKGEPVELFTVYSLAGVSNGPTVPSVFTLEETTYITILQTYHYLSGGATPGTIALESEDGETFGPYQAAGAPGQGGVNNAYWQATVNEFIPAGTYTFVDSDPSTWSIAPDTGGRGICWVFGIPPSGGG